jgi:hypothetical protein
VTDNLTWSFRRGEWFGIFGAHATVVLPPSEKARVGAIWALVDDGAGFDEALDALISSGLRELPGFVLVSEADGVTRVVLRGAARAHFATYDEVVHVEGEGATTWVERTLHGVTRMRIEVAEETDADDLVVGGGLVRIATAEQPPAVPQAEIPVEPQADVQSEAEPEPEPAPEAEPVSEPEPVLPDALGEPASEPPAFPPPEAEPVTAAFPVVEPPFGPPPEPPTEPPNEPPLVPTHDHDGLTRSGSQDPAQFARLQPGIPGQPPAPSVTARPVARLVFSSGAVVEVDRAVLVGRAPETGRFSSSEEPRLVTVPSPHQEISSTHLEVRPGSGADHGSAVVTDLGSTNGTLLLQPGLPPEDLKAGVAVQLIPGAVLDLGDGVTIQILNP